MHEVCGEDPARAQEDDSVPVVEGRGVSSARPARCKGEREGDDKKPILGQMEPQVEESLRVVGIKRRLRVEGLGKDIPVVRQLERDEHPQYDGDWDQRAQRPVEAPSPREPTGPYPVRHCASPCQQQAVAPGEDEEAEETAGEEG